MLDILTTVASYPLTLGQVVLFYFLYQFVATLCDIARRETPKERDARSAREAQGSQ